MFAIHPQQSVFVKTHIRAIHDGIIAEIGADNWATLCVLASFMDADGRCYPTQDAIAERLGITRVAATRRIARLLECTWRGQPLVTVERRKGRQGYRNEYRIIAENVISIF